MQFARLAIDKMRKHYLRRKWRVNKAGGGRDFIYMYIYGKYDDKLRWRLDNERENRRRFDRGIIVI